MKRFTTIPVLIILLGFMACNRPTSSRQEKVADINDTTGYFAARNLKGLAMFNIGESTYKEVLDIIQENIRQDSRRYKESNHKEKPRYIGYNPKYKDYKFDKKGNIISSFYRENFGSIYKEIKYDTTKVFLNRDILNREIFGCPNLREIELFEYYIGDIKLSNLNLKFYKDTLFQITCNQEDKIEEGFKVKYGDGILTNNSVWETPRGKTNQRPDDNDVLRKSKLLKIDEKIIWQNELLIAESQTYHEYKYDGDKYLGGSYSNSYFRITTKNEIINKQISDCKKSALETKKKLEQQSKTDDINKL